MVLLGLVLGGILVAHAGTQIARAFPDEVRANARASVRRHPRMLAVAIAVAAWTTVYALYSLAYPNSAAVLAADNLANDVVTEVRQAPDAVSDNRELLPPSLGGELALPSSATATVTPEPSPASTPAADDTPTTTTTPTTTAPGAPPPEPEPCPAQAIADALGPQAVGVLCPEGSAP